MTTGHQLFVVNCFRIAGWVIGVPSFVSLLCSGGAWCVLYLRPAPSLSAPLDIKTYGLIALMGNAARDLGGVFEFLLSAGQWALAGLAIVSLLITLFAAGLYFTGRGIGHHSTAARIVAILIFVVFLFASTVALLALRSNIAPVAYVPLCISLYVLWVLCWRFS